MAVVELEEDEQGEEQTGHSCYVRIHLEETAHNLEYFPRCEQSSDCECEKLPTRRFLVAGVSA